eukprot:Hpha_TRINITY_DN24231_c0_g1::TRINITY_DN24231_c0_g1_i1::g.36071::m.36071
MRDNKRGAEGGFGCAMAGYHPVIHSERRVSAASDDTAPVHTPRLPRKRYGVQDAGAEDEGGIVMMAATLRDDEEDTPLDALGGGIQMMAETIRDDEGDTAGGHQDEVGGGIQMM